MYDHVTPDQRKQLLTETVDHEGHAKCTELLYGEKFRHNDAFGWMKYNGTFWEREGAQKAVERAITNTLIIRAHLFVDADKEKPLNGCHRSRANINGTRDQLKISESIDVKAELFDSNPNWLNCGNGVVDLRTGILLPHDPNQYLSYVLPVNYCPNADTAPWLDFLRSLSLSESLIDYLQMAVGYSLTGHTFEEIMFYLYGPPRSGKGTFTETIDALMGELSAGVGFSTFTSERNGDNNNFDLAPLRFKRFVTASESTRHHMLSAATIKKVTGGDSVYCAFKHQTHFSYRPQYKIWLTSNWPVNADVDDDAAWGRLRIIPFSHSFLEHEDKSLKHRMKTPEMMTAVLAWAISGAMRWYALGTDGLPILEELRTQSKAQRDENDTVGQFIAAQCAIRDGEISPTATLYLHYSTWCNDEGYKPRSRKAFVQAMATRGISSIVARYKGSLTRVLVGIVYQSDIPI